MGVKHNLPSLKNAVMDLPNVKNVMENEEGEKGRRGPAQVWGIDKLILAKFVNKYQLTYASKRILLGNVSQTHLSKHIS